MANSTMVSKDFENVDKFQNKKLTLKSRQGSSPASAKQYPPASGMSEAQFRITNRPGESLVAGVVREN